MIILGEILFCEVRTKKIGPKKRFKNFMKNDTQNVPDFFYEDK